MVRISAWCDGYEATTRDPYPDDSWDRGDTEFILHDIIVRLDEHGEFDLDVSAGDTVYAVVAVYDTGDTFGRDERRHSVMGLFDKVEDAEIVHEKYKGFVPHHSRRERITAWGFVHDEVHYYVPWLGYFERYVDCYVTDLEVQHAESSRTW